MTQLSTMHSRESAVEELVSQLADDFIRQMERGEDPPIDQYAQQHPQAADIIRRTLGALKTMRSVELWKLDGDLNTGNERHIIGDFRLIRMIGRGGMGIVYEAEQLSLNRRVALKVLPHAAMLDDRALQRFKNEVTAAAQLDHPNIVPVHGVGCDRGVHHYAMRLVDGVTLAEIIDQLRDLRAADQDFPESISSLNTSAPSNDAASTSEENRRTARSTVASDTQQVVARTSEMTSNHRMSWKKVRQPSSHFRSVAQLGATIAKALDHAHHHGIVHRDVKPSNILIDGSAQPWVADFGLAQVETGTAITLTGDILGTARYMSPEQVLGNRLILDHRTDIYSLGVTLYELLCLNSPFDGNDRRELFHRIATEESANPRQINPAIPVDLATIVGKAVEKDPDDRYQTALSLAEDLRRFIESQPIVARPHNLLKRTSKWMARHSTLSWAAVIVLVIVAITSSAAAVMVTRAFKNEQAARRRADELTQNNLKLSYQAKQAIDQYVKTVGNAAMLEDPAALGLRNELLGWAREYYLALVDMFRQSDARLELADAMLQLESLTAESVTTDEAVAITQDAIDLLTTNQFSEHEEGRKCALLAEWFNRLSVRLEKLGDHQGNQEAAIEAIKYSEQANQIDPHNLDWQASLAIFLSNRGTFLLNTAEVSAAVPLLQRSAGLMRQLVEKEPHNRSWKTTLAHVLFELARTNQDRSLSLKAFQDVADIASELVRQQSDDPESLFLLARCYKQQEQHFLVTGELKQKRAAIEQAISTAETLVDLRPHSSNYRRFLASCHEGLGTVLAESGDVTSALELFDKAAEDLERISVADPNVIKCRTDLSSSLMKVACMLAEKQDYSLATDYFHKSISLSEALIVQDPENRGFRADAILTYTLWVVMDLAQRNQTGAAQKVKTARDLFPDFEEPGPTNPQERYLFARVNQLSGELAYDEMDWRESLEFFRVAYDQMRQVHRKGFHMDDYVLTLYASGLLDSMVRVGETHLVPNEIERMVIEFPSVDMLALATRIYFEISELEQGNGASGLGKTELIKRGTEAANQALELMSTIDNSHLLAEAVVDLCLCRLPLPIAERVYQEVQKKFGTGENGKASWELIVSSLRAGRFQKCLEFLNTHTGSPSGPGIDNLNHVLARSLVYHYLEQDDDASMWLEKAKEIVSSADYLSRQSRQLLSQAKALVER